mmetsp:Transcript_4978/g.11296  ORF Transcript_4978/g.11296 Transcript_4978/m.11296 type:complete len:300 (+) Transcript_4978:57-956(+)
MSTLDTIHDGVLISVGAWLFVYRLGLRTRCRPYAEALTTAGCGLSLALLAPLLSWPPVGFRFPMLAVLGVLFSFCHPVFTATVVALPLGISLSAILWQFGLCTFAPGTHAVLLTLISIVFIFVFVCTPGVAGPYSLRLFLVPSLSALLLALGIADLVPELDSLRPRTLLQDSPCSAAEGDTSAVLNFLGLWLLLAACGIGFQLLLTWLAKRKIVEGAAAGGDGGDLAQSLLPGAQANKDGGMQRPDMGSDNRFTILCKAIFAEEGADQSHLSESEQKIVEVCRKDEFERDRLVWGGGLI